MGAATAARLPLAVGGGLDQLHRHLDANHRGAEAGRGRAQCGHRGRVGPGGEYPSGHVVGAARWSSGRLLRSALAAVHRSGLPLRHWRPPGGAYYRRPDAPGSAAGVHLCPRRRCGRATAGVAVRHPRVGAEDTAGRSNQAGNGGRQLRPFGGARVSWAGHRLVRRAGRLCVERAISDIPRDRPDLLAPTADGVGGRAGALRTGIAGRWSLRLARASCAPDPAEDHVVHCTRGGAVGAAATGRHPAPRPGRGRLRRAVRGPRHRRRPGRARAGTGTGSAVDQRDARCGVCPLRGRPRRHRVCPELRSGAGDSGVHRAGLDWGDLNVERRTGTVLASLGPRPRPGGLHGRLHRLNVRRGLGLGIAGRGSGVANHIGIVWSVPETANLDREPAVYWGEPRVAFDPAPDAGPVLVTVEYVVTPEREADFLRAMSHLRQSRLRTGGTSWELYRDGERPDRFVEIFSVPSWEEHLRQHEGRLTGTDQEIEETVLAFSDPPARAEHLLPP